jgi:hypothetical protein
LAVAWDNNKFIFIDNESESITCILNHPTSEKQNIRCWGLAKVSDFDINKCPFVISRDNIGYVLINVKTMKAYQWTFSAITANLFGHGDILRVVRVDDN